MTVKNTSTISRKLTRTVLAASAAAVVFSGLSFIALYSVMSFRTTVRDLTTLAQITGENCAAALVFRIPDDAETVLATLDVKSTIVQARLQDADDHLFAVFTRPGSSSRPPDGALPRGYAYRDGSLWVQIRIVREGAVLGSLWLQDNLLQLRVALARNLWTLGGVMVLALVGAYAVSTRLLERATSPILHLTETARSVTQKQDYSVRVFKESDDEVGVLTESFNQMLGRIQERDVDLRRANRELALAHENLERQVALRTNELARSNRDLQQFAYAASHDLQEPLRTVASYTQLLARKYKGQLGADADEFIHYAVDGCLRMQNLIHALLSYSRVDMQGHTLVDMDAARLVAEAVSNLRSAVEESGAEITCDALPTVTVDAAQLVLLFQNLIGNGIKFKGDKQPRIHVSAERRDGYWQFAVSDNGIGIDMQYKDRIFVIFQRLHTRRHYEGTGMGLAYCKKIVEGLGGRIWLESLEGQGSTFYFTVPERRSAEHE